MRAFCVNIQSESGRKQHCIREYAAASIEYEFINAVDGRSQRVLPPKAKDASETDRWHAIDKVASTYGFLNETKTSPAKACALSHYMAWEKAAVQSSKDGRHHLINEDDFQIGDIETLEETLLEVHNSKFDIVYLGYRGGENQKKSSMISAQKSWHQIKYALSKRKLKDKVLRNYTLNKYPKTIRGLNHIMKAGMTWGGHAYIINQQGAQALMECNRNLRFLPDEALRWVIMEGKVKVGMSRIKHFTCADFGSAIRSENEHKEHHQRFSSK